MALPRWALAAWSHSCCGGGPRRLMSGTLRRFQPVWLASMGASQTAQARAVLQAAHWATCTRARLSASMQLLLVLHKTACSGEGQLNSHATCHEHPAPDSLGPSLEPCCCLIQQRQPSGSAVIWTALLRGAAAGVASMQNTGGPQPKKAS